MAMHAGPWCTIYMYMYITDQSIQITHSTFRLKESLLGPLPPVTWIGLIGLRGTVVTWVLLYLHQGVRILAYTDELGVIPGISEDRGLRFDTLRY